MNSRYDYLELPSERRLMAALRASVALLIVIVLAAGAILAPPGEHAAAPAAARPAAEAPMQDDGYDGPAAFGAWPARPGDREQLESYDQLHPHAYPGQHGVAG